MSMKGTSRRRCTSASSSNMPGHSTWGLLAAERGDRLAARRLELIAGLPLGHGIGLGDEPGAEHIELRVLNHAVETPAAVELVGGLMIFLQFPLLDLLAAPVRRPSDEVGAVVEEQRRHPDPRERELIGA